MLIEQEEVSPPSLAVIVTVLTVPFMLCGYRTVMTEPEKMQWMSLVVKVSVSASSSGSSTYGTRRTRTARRIEP